MTTSEAMTAEAELLLAHLRSQRRHVLGILEGLDEEALRRPVLPSGWSCLGLVRHLALDDERFWFRRRRGRRAGDPGRGRGVHAERLAGPRTDESAEHGTAPATARRPRGPTRSSRSTPLDAAPAWWPDFFGEFRMDSLREVLMHVITETATHAGHLDAVRELIDGRTWLVLD